MSSSLHLGILLLILYFCIGSQKIYSSQKLSLCSLTFWIELQTGQLAAQFQLTNQTAERIKPKELQVVPLTLLMKMMKQVLVNRAPILLI